MVFYMLHFHLRLTELVSVSCFIPSPPSVGWSLHQHLPGEPRQSHLGHHRFQPQPSEPLEAAWDPDIPGEMWHVLQQLANKSMGITWDCASPRVMKNICAPMGIYRQ